MELGAGSGFFNAPCPPGRCGPTCSTPQHGGMRRVRIAVQPDSRRLGRQQVGKRRGVGQRRRVGQRMGAVNFDIPLHRMQVFFAKRVDEGDSRGAIVLSQPSNNVQPYVLCGEWDRASEWRANKWGRGQHTTKGVTNKEQRTKNYEPRTKLKRTTTRTKHR